MLSEYPRSATEKLGRFEFDRVVREERRLGTSTDWSEGLTIPTVSDAKELIGLAERMGIPTEDAVRCAVMLMAEPRRLEYDVEAAQAGSAQDSVSGSRVDMVCSFCGRRRGDERTRR
jgi:hypothetical protein